MDRVKQEIPHSESALFEGRFHKPWDDLGLEHSKGRHFAQISHASIGGFEAHLAIITEGASIMLKLERLLTSSFSQVPTFKWF